MKTTDRTALRITSRLVAATAAALLLAAIVASGSATAALGVFDFSGYVKEKDGSIATQAAGHPYEGATTMYFASHPDSGPLGQIVANEQPKNVLVELPPGLIGNPQAATECTPLELSDKSSGAAGCPLSSQVGLVWVPPFSYNFDGGGTALYNMVPPPGKAAMFGFNIADASVMLVASVRTGDDYGINIQARYLNQYQGTLASKVVLWGTPSSPDYDSIRGICSFVGGKCPSDAPAIPLITNSSNCSAGLMETRLKANSWQDPEAIEELSFTSDEDGQPLYVDGCDEVPFTPSFRAAPTTTAADSPTGLSVNIEIPQGGFQNSTAIAQANLKEAVVTLPEGMAINPPAANGTESCTAAQIELNGPNPAACPNASKIGAVEIATPVLDHTVKGGIYLAKQSENKFGSLLATYIAVHDPISGVVVKLAGKVEPDPVTGRLVTTFDDNPQLPFEDLHVEFYGGPNASLRTPPACGTYSTKAEMSSWAAVDPDNPTAGEIRTIVDPFQITTGPNGTPCPTGAFSPKLEAGSANPTGGEYSPFVLRLTREDGTQLLGGLSLKLPKGLTGKLAGVTYCPEAALAGISPVAGTGAGELASPACPASSQVGTVVAGAGAGSNPFYVNTGKAYLAGSYKGAPLSLVVVTPAVAGPFDLGTVVVRNALHVDPATAEITAVSDPFPTILHGITLDLRDIRVRLDRPEFGLNPTNCEELAFEGSASSAAGAIAPIRDRFQAANCASLGFGPKLKLSLKGGTKRSAHPALTAVLTQPFGRANIGKTSVVLPKSQFIDQSRIGEVCTRAQYAADACPAKSILGKATAYTPLLDQPLTGTVYLRANGGERELPDMVAALRGQIDIDLVGYVDAVVKPGTEISRIRNTFAVVPDAPVSKFVLKLNSGKRALLENSANLCARPQRATVKMRGQNGKTHNFQPLIANSCKKKK